MELEKYLKEHGPSELLSLIVESCDKLADHASFSGKKIQADYWRDVGIKFFKLSPQIYQFEKTNRRAP